ncbi:MAG: hypothetical protein ACW981_05600 [Candidatus Hodarchaeales archaeon]
MTRKIQKKKIEIDFQFKEKNCSLQDYKSVALAWLKSQAVFRDTLKKLEDQDLLSHELAWRLYKDFRTADIDYKLKKLRLLELTSDVNDSDPPSQNPTLQIPAGKTILPSFTKDALKEKIVQLAKHQDQPNFKFEALIKTTNGLLNHPDLTDDEKYRYAIYYSELIEYRNYKQLEREEKNYQQQQRNLEHDLYAYSTSISQIRNKMANQLEKYRETYRSDNETKISRG